MGNPTLVRILTSIGLELLATTGTRIAKMDMTMNLYDRIPNNVNLSENKKLQFALEKWLPNYLDWWREMGPDGFQDKDIWLRTAIDVGADGWAHFDYVKMPDYRWGIFLEPSQHEAIVGFGNNYQQPAYQQVPYEFRDDLRRIIVTQADTEPASVEQQRQLGKTCPSLYDLRNLFQVNVEEGRHLWAMVYLLHGYFGRDGDKGAAAIGKRLEQARESTMANTVAAAPRVDLIHPGALRYLREIGLAR